MPGPFQTVCTLSVGKFRLQTEIQHKQLTDSLFGRRVDNNESVNRLHMYMQTATLIYRIKDLIKAQNK